MLVAGLCAAALAVAILAAAAVQRALPDFARAGPIRSAPLPLPRIDAHQHVGPATAGAALRIAALHGIGTVVNLAGGGGRGRAGSAARGGAPARRSPHRLHEPGHRRLL